MSAERQKRQPQNSLARAIIEVAFIIFLFYSNLLMGQYTADQPSKSFAYALQNIFTARNFAIAVVSAMAGYVVFEYLRRRS